jgi:very-short-patch-repair endonuclease
MIGDVLHTLRGEMTKVSADYADDLAKQLDWVRITHEREFRFHPTRRWRADFLLPNKVLVEVDGGNRMAIIHKGRAVAVGNHTKDSDYEKLNWAALLGYRVLRFSPKQVKSGDALMFIERILDDSDKSGKDILHNMQKKGGSSGEKIL